MPQLPNIIDTTGITAVRIPSGRLFAWLKDFKTALLEKLKHRFTNNEPLVAVFSSGVQMIAGKVPRIAKHDVPYSTAYQLATVLDPRLKLYPFSGSPFYIRVIPYLGRELYLAL